MLVLLDINSVLSSTAVGYIGTGVAAVFFGSNYVVTKQVPIGDGFAFQWFMSLGILLVGYACLFISGDPIWVLDGFIGGALWAAGNAVVPLCIQWAGLALPFLLWSITNLLMGWFVGKFGLFGVEPETVPTPWLNDLGPLFGILALICYVLVKPTIKPDKEEITAIQANLDYEDSTDGSEDTPFDIPHKNKHGSKLSVNEGPMPVEEKKTFGARAKQIAAYVIALTVGLLYGVSLAPFQNWFDSVDTTNSNALMFVISHYSGIFLMSSTVFVVYAVITKNRPKIYAKSVLPAMVSGAMWGVAEAAWMVSNGTLGMVISYPIVAVCPMLINTLWAVLLYREIEGKRNFLLLGVAMSLNIISVICTALSSIEF